MRRIKQLFIIIICLGAAYSLSTARDGGHDGRDKGGEHRDSSGSDTNRHDGGGDDDHNADTTRHNNDSTEHDADSTHHGSDSTEHHGGIDSTNHRGHGGNDSTHVDDHGADSTRHGGIDSTGHNGDDHGVDSTGHHGRGGNDSDSTRGRHGDSHHVGSDDSRVRTDSTTLNNIRRGQSSHRQDHGEGEGHRNDDETHGAPTPHVEGIQSTVTLQVLPVFPNPVLGGSGTAIVRYALSAATNVRVTVYGEQSDVVWTWQDAVPSGSHDLPINVAGLREGNYLVTVQAGAAVQTQKLQVIR